MQQISQALAEALQTNRTTPVSPKSNWRPTLDAYEPSLKTAADRCAQLIADMESEHEPYWLTLCGVTGAGKTMLARQCFEFAAKNCNPGRHSLWVAGTGVYCEGNRRPRCVWHSTTSFKDAMLGGDYNLPEYLRGDYLVAIDDLGAAKDTRDNALADGLYRLADQRAHRWMIWTTNLTLAEIAERLDPRIASRLIRDENRLVKIAAGDYALRRKGAA